MVHKNRKLARSGNLDLIQSVNEKGGKKYLIKFSRGHGFVSYQRRASLDRIFDPFDNRWNHTAAAWKFNTRKEAEELLILATLKGLAR